MRRTANRMKMAALLASGSMLFQFGGCLSLDSFWRNMQIGFSQQIGAIPAQAVYDLTIGSLIDPLLGSNGAA